MTIVSDNDRVVVKGAKQLEKELNLRFVFQPKNSPDLNVFDSRLFRYIEEKLCESCAKTLGKKKKKTLSESNAAYERRIARTVKSSEVSKWIKATIGSWRDSVLKKIAADPTVVL